MPDRSDRAADRDRARATTTRTTSACSSASRTADGEVAHTACVGFGMERIALALFRTHGLDPERWPRRVRERALAVMRADVVARGPDAGALRPSPAARARTASGPRPTATSTSGSSCSTRSASIRVAALAFALALDFEGDQWQFFKSPLEDLRRALRRSSVQELADLAAGRQHVARAAGRGPAADRRGGRLLSARHRRHLVRRRAREDHDRASRRSTSRRGRLGYFHNAGYYELDGRRLRRRSSPRSPGPTLFRPTSSSSGSTASAGLEPPSSWRSRARRWTGALRARARRQSGRRFARAPDRRPRVAARPADVHVPPVRLRHPAPVRRLLELAATFLRWLGVSGAPGLEPAAAAYQRVSESAKAMQFTAGARGGRPETWTSARCSMRWSGTGTRQSRAARPPRHGD